MANFAGTNQPTENQDVEPLPTSPTIALQLCVLVSTVVMPAVFLPHLLLLHRQ